MDNKSLIPITKESLDDIEKRYGKLERNRVYQTYCEWRKKSRLTDKKNNMLILNKIRFAHRKKNKLCVSCGIKLNDYYNYTLCEKCRERDKKYPSRNTSRTKRKEKINLKKQGRKCLWCEEPIPLKKLWGTKYCDKKCKNKYLYQKRKGGE